jgi:hypothetical protein
MTKEKAEEVTMLHLEIEGFSKAIEIVKHYKENACEDCLITIDFPSDCSKKGNSLSGLVGLLNENSKMRIPKMFQDDFVGFMLIHLQDRLNLAKSKLEKL